MNIRFFVTAGFGLTLAGCTPPPILDQDIICWDEIAGGAIYDEKYSPTPNVVCVPIAMSGRVPPTATLRPDISNEGGGGGGGGTTPSRPPPSPSPSPSPDEDRVAIVNEGGNVAIEGNRIAIVTPREQVASDGDNVVSLGPNGTTIVTDRVSVTVGPNGVAFIN